MDSLLNQFGNREIASLIWVVGILILMMSKSDLRKSMGGVLKAFFQWTLLRIFIIALFYILLIVWLLYWRDIWTFENLKTTILWSLTFAFVAIFRANQIQEDDRYFTRILRDLITITPVLIFIIELHNCSLIIELIAVPLITIIVMMHTVSQTENDYKKVTKFLGRILSILGFGYLLLSIWKTIDNIESFATINILREFLFPILLSILFLPFIFLLGIHMAYENTFKSMNNWLNDKPLLSYTIRQALLKYGTNIDYLNRWKQHVQVQRPQNKSAIDQSFQYIKSILDREKNPLDIPIERGWSPWIAKDFMDDFDLKTRDYRESFDNEWFADSNMLETDGGWPKNYLSCNIEGTRDTVQTLKLKLNINNLQSRKTSKKLFSDTIFYLIRKACHEEPKPSIKKRIEDLIEFERYLTHHKLSLEKINYPVSQLKGYQLIFVISSLDVVSSKPYT